MRNALKSVALFAVLALAPTTASAQFAVLHGFGPINSSMGGAGVALPEDSLNALGFNPALMTAVEGNQLSFATEFQKDDLQLKITSGSATGDAKPGAFTNVIPHFGWMSRDPRKKMALGFGLISEGGFSTDYAADNSSLLFAQPPKGLSRVYSDYKATKIPVAFAFQVTPQLSVGASMNVYLGQLSIAPLTSVADTASNGSLYYPEAGKPSLQFAFAPQFGVYFKASPMLSLGASVTMKQTYSGYSWVSTNADPTSRVFGTNSTVNYNLDGPMVASFGVGLTPDAKTGIAVDAMYTRYTGTRGFGSSGGYTNGLLAPLAWQDVWSFKVGVRRDIDAKTQVRLGYNYSQTPVRSEVIMSSIIAPATFQQRFSFGLGRKIFPFLSAEASAYISPRNHVTGPYMSSSNVNLGTIDMSDSLMAALVGFNFRF